MIGLGALVDKLWVYSIFFVVKSNNGFAYLILLPCLVLRDSNNDESISKLILYYYNRILYLFIYIIYITTFNIILIIIVFY